LSRPAAIAALKRHFPTAGQLVYLNSGSYGLLADSVRAAFNAYLDERTSLGANWGGWTDREEAVRTRMARLLDADPGEIAITASASAGINAFASGVDFSDGRNRVLVSQYEFPTSAQIWHAQAARGAQVEMVMEDEGGALPVARFAEMIDDRTAVVVLSHVCYRHGGKIPDADVREITRIAHERGAMVILDVFQSIGAEVIDVAALGVDACVGGMMKYLLGTAGIGFLYVRKDRIATINPSATGWFAQADIGAMDILAHRPSMDARRFQAGTPPVPNCFAAAAGLDIILQAGPAAIEEEVRRITRHAIERLDAAGIGVASPRQDERRGPLITIAAADAPQLVDRLMQRSIVTSCRDGRLRAGFHFYNDEEDVECFVEALAANRALIGPAGA